MNVKVRAVAYIRRSTKDQAQSLDRQRAEITLFARANGIEIAQWFVDDGVSGVEDAARPNFCLMVAAAERHEFDLIVVHEISRFGRFDAFQSGSWLHRLKNAGVRVQAIEGSIKNPYSIEGKLLLALETDRGESKKLSFRTLSGQRLTASRGLRAGGKVPYGFARRVCRADRTLTTISRIGRGRRDKSDVVELVLGDAVEVEAVRTIFRMALDGAGYRSIAQHLNDSGVVSPDGARQRTIATSAGRWTASTVRSILLQPAYCGDAIWNCRSMPKFHRLEGDKIVEIDEFETNRYRRNSRADWVVVPNAHPALVDRAVFDAVQEKMRSHRSMPRGHRNEFLLTGLISCATEHCTDILTGTTRTRRKLVDGAEKVYTDPIYTCGGPLRARGGHAQVGLPRDRMERAVIRILDQEVFSDAALAQLESILRLEVARRSAGEDRSGVVALERRELELKNKVAESARRILSVDEALVPAVKAAAAELQAELDRVRQSIERAKRNVALAVDGEALVQKAVAGFRAMRAMLHDPTVPLERRRDVLRKVLPMVGGQRPIRVHFDRDAQRGWRKALRKVTVRHVSVRFSPDMTPKMVAGAGFEPATSGL